MSASRCAGRRLFPPKLHLELHLRIARGAFPGRHEEAWVFSGSVRSEPQGGEWVASVCWQRCPGGPMGAQG